MKHDEPKVFSGIIASKNLILTGELSMCQLIGGSNIQQLSVKTMIQRWIRLGYGVQKKIDMRRVKSY